MNENEESRIEVKDIEKSIERMLKRANGEKDLTVKRDGIIILKKQNDSLKKF